MFVLTSDRKTVVSTEKELTVAFTRPDIRAPEVYKGSEFRDGRSSTVLLTQQGQIH